MSQKEGKFEKVVAYVNKSLTVAQRKVHPMEGECYALIWGIMHFRQYLHKNHFILRIDHKPLEWLMTVLGVHGKRGRWIDMLQEFCFKILHQPRLNHINVDALSRNPVGPATYDDDFSEEIQDIGNIQVDMLETKEKMFSIQTKEGSKWFGFRRHVRKLTQHHKCCFGINQWFFSRDHQLYMLNVVIEVDQDEELDSLLELIGAASVEESEILSTTDGKQTLKRKIPKYYDR